MSNTTNEPVFQYTLHKRLWNILADNPGMLMSKALNGFFTEEERKEFRHGCAACTYPSMFSYDDTDFCFYCPLDAEGIEVDPIMDMAGQCFKGLYGAWALTTDLLILKDSIAVIFEGNIASWIQDYYEYNDTEMSVIVDHLGPDYNEEKIKELCSKYARMIADLPVKSGVKYI